MVRNQRDEHQVRLVGSDANSTSVVTISVGSDAWAAIAPAGVTTSTIAKWLRVNDDGTDYYLPMWT